LYEILQYTYRHSTIDHNVTKIVVNINNNKSFIIIIIIIIIIITDYLMKVELSARGWFTKCQIVEVVGIMVHRKVIFNS